MTLGLCLSRTGGTWTPRAVSTVSLALSRGVNYCLLFLKGELRQEQVLRFGSTAPGRGW